MKDIKQDVDLVLTGLKNSNTDEGFIELITPILPALIRGQPNAYMSAVELVGLAEEIVLDLYSEEAFLDFGKFLDRSAESVKRCAMSSMVTNENGTPRSND